ncbi:MAG: HrpE/YscL family type III secretion apparatus protein [Pseudomonadota bacterium]
MATFVRLRADRPTIEPGQRVLSQDDYATRLTAEDLLDDARLEGDRIIEEARQTFEAEKKRGYEEGMSTANAEIAEQMMTIVTRSVDYLATAEGEVAKTVMLCLRKILGETPEEDLVIAAARNALSIVRNEARVAVVVRPDVQDEVKDRIGEILKGHGDVGFIEIVTDSGLPKGGCRLETEVGVVDASIDVQIDAIENAMKSRVRDT